MKNLQIQQRYSSLKDLITIEYIDKNLLKFIIDNAELQTIKYVANCGIEYESEKSYLLKIWNLINKKNELIVKNIQADNNIGRVNPYGGLSLSHIRRELRHTLAYGNYIDIDIKNAQPTMLQQICVFNKIKCPELTKYINNRDDILKETQDFYKCTRDEAKTLFIRIMFLGGFNGWVNDFHILNIEQTTFIKNITAELKLIANMIIKKNPEYHKTNKDAHYPSATTMAFYLQNIECSILEIMYNFLKEKKLLGKTKIPHVILCHDGIMIKNLNLLDKVQLLKDIEAEITLKSTFTLKLEIKEFSEKIDIEDLKLKKQLLMDNISFDNITKFDNAYFNKLSNYDIQKKYFELFMCKVLLPNPLYVFTDCVNDKKELIFLTQKKLLEFGKHLQDKFINSWIADQNIRLYNKLEYNPVNPGLELNKGNNEFFNIFPGYNPKIKTVIDNYNIIDDWKNVVLQLCEGNQINYDYYIKWLAHIIQYPNKKIGICIIIKSNEGVGKNAHLDAFKQIINHSSYFSSAEIDDFFGKFAIAYSNTLLANYNEAKSCHNIIDKLKASVTEEYITVEKKGIDKIVFKNHTRLIITTNNDNTITITDSNRRFIIYQGTDFFKGNTQFWNNYFKVIETDEFIAALYYYLNNIDLTNWDYNDFPKTKAYEATRLRNISSEIMFISEYIAENQIDTKIKGITFYENYKTYCQNMRLDKSDISIKDFYFKIEALENNAIRGITKITMAGGRIGFSLNYQLIKKSLIDKKYISNENLFID